MRTIAILFALFVGHAYACPSLTGNYKCSYKDGSSEAIRITQSEVNGVTEYVYNGSTIRTDNTAYPAPDDENVRQATFRAWCEDESAKGNLVGKYFNEGAYFGELDMTMSLSLNGTNLKTQTTGVLLAEDGTSYPFDETTDCTPN